MTHIATKLATQAALILAIPANTVESKVEAIDSAIVLTDAAYSLVAADIGVEATHFAWQPIDWKAVDAWAISEDDSLTYENGAIVSRDTSREG